MAVRGLILSATLICAMVVVCYGEVKLSELPVTLSVATTPTKGSSDDRFSEEEEGEEWYVRVDKALTPYVGQSFEDVEDAVTFYKAYVYDIPSWELCACISNEVIVIPVFFRLLTNIV
ncbi:hypothetical protein RND81_04G106300 [Saponaria officinalis]|uniref:Uncharacterized protein n=1 Tax=Saponaria officinalis TaxID=3572 RepID=A0AAW1LLQ8_SAPOF